MISPQTRVGQGVRAVVFDLNGTLVDDISFHYEAWKALADRVGFPMDPALFQSCNGLKNEDIFPRFLGRAVEAAELASLGAEKESRYRDLYRPHLSPVAGAEAFFAKLRAAGVKLAVASSAPIENRTMVLEGLAWTRTFDIVVANEGLRGKPEPDIFLAAAAHLGVEPPGCLVFEDAVNGVKAGRAAGMPVIGVTTNVTARELLAAGAMRTISDFTELGPVDALLA